MEAEKVKARRRFDQAKKALSANRWGSTSEVEDLLKQYIISVVAVFAHEACELGRVSAWGVVEMHSEVLDFLHRFKAEAYAGRGHDTNGHSLPEHGLKDSDFTACPEWERYEDSRLEVAEAQGVDLDGDESHIQRRLRAQEQIENHNKLRRASNEAATTPIADAKKKRQRQLREPDQELLRKTETVNRKQAAMGLGISERTLDRMVADKVLHPTGPFRSKRFKTKELLRLLNQKH